MTLLLTTFLVALTLADQAGTAPVVGRASASGTILNIPYLPQTRALCGGAAAAMVFRYWGDRHADVQQFANLVDPRGLGIADDLLVEEIRQRHWQAVPLVASLAIVRERIAAGQPLILLLQDRPGRYHYVVAVGADRDAVFLHDPTWGPSRRYTDDELTRLWKPSNFWALLVLPGQAPPAPEAPVGRALTQQPDVGRVPSDPATARSECDRLLGEAIDDIAARGLESADDILARVGRACPSAAAPAAELAAVRFVQKRWEEAEDLASEAVRRDPSYAYAWDVLGSTRFVRNDLYGALRAWNRIGKPQLDSVRIDGLSRTRYVLVADALALAPNTMLTEAAFRLAERRLQQLPNRLGARMGYQPADDGFATLDVVVVERPRWPRGSAQWIGEASRAAVQREARAAAPGWTGQGEVWSASWRWWSDRPRVAMSFAAPRVGVLRGISRVEASWERQTYQQAADPWLIRETRLHGGFATTDWLTANLGYELAVGVDSWDARRRTISVGGRVERRLFDDRVAAAAIGHAWAPLSSGPAFRWGSLTGSFQSSPDARGFVQLVNAGIEAATEHAPLALWSGAGNGHGRRPLLRAHPLLSGGVISGPVFGRQAAYVNVESQRWLERPSLVHLGFAAFVDVAKAARGFTPGSHLTHTDIGAGLRIRIPGSDGVLRADYSHGLRDGQKAFTFGWQLRP